MKRLILCADDFAANEAASLGIAALANAGRVSATSAMVLSPRWATDAALLQAVRKKIDVGLHLDWTSGFAHSAGHGMSLGRAMLRSMLGGFDQKAARAVIDHQLDAFEAVWKSPPDHIDGHQHVQQFAGIRQALTAAVVQRYAPNNRPYLRLSTGVATDKSTKTKVIAAMGASRLGRLAESAGIAHAPALSGIYDFSGGGQRYADLMHHWLQSAPDGCIVMCHPALRAGTEDEIGPARAWEYGYLRSDGFAQALITLGIVVCRGTQINSAA